MAQVSLSSYRTLFEPDNIKDRISNREIEKIGGYAGLEEILKTNFQVPSHSPRTESPPLRPTKKTVSESTGVTSHW